MDFATAFMLLMVAISTVCGITMLFRSDAR